MGRRLLVGSLLVLVAIYFVASPEAAAGTIRHAGTSVGHVMHQLTVFLRSL